MNGGIEIVGVAVDHGQCSVPLFRTLVLFIPFTLPSLTSIDRSSVIVGKILCIRGSLQLKIYNQMHQMGDSIQRCFENPILIF